MHYKTNCMVTMILIKSALQHSRRFVTRQAVQTSHTGQTTGTTLAILVDIKPCLQQMHDQPIIQCPEYNKHYNIYPPIAAIRELRIIPITYHRPILMITK